MANGRPEARNPIKGAVRTVDILTALKELDGAGTTELADHLGLAKSNVHNYLSTLHQEGYVRKDGTTYHVGLRLLELGAYARQQRPVYEVAKPEIRSLAEETGERVNLMVEEHGMGTYLHFETGSRAVKVDVHVGSRVYLHNTALGKAILAHLPEERVGEILDWHGMPRTTEHTITDRAELFDELADIRDRGVAYDREERLKNLRCVAAPVLGKNDRIEGAVSISGPKTRFGDERFEEELPEQLHQTVNVVGINLTYR
jgi:DNA-binding IclR family transcriptional regulator